MRLLFAFCCVALLSGCYSKPVSHWQHKTIPSEQWRPDLNRCKREVDKYLGAYDDNHADQGLDNYSETMRVYDVRKKQQKLVGDCMRRNGYVPMN